MKLEIMKLQSDKIELIEQAKLNDSVPNELVYLEKILEEKEKELNEIEESLAVARRYQMLYVELTIEKQEIEAQLRTFSIENDSLKEKVDQLKQENEQLKYKTKNFDKVQKESLALSKEIQKYQIRLNFLEASKDQSEQANDLSKAITTYTEEISDLTTKTEELESELKNFKKKYEMTLSRSFLLQICHAFKQHQGNSFRK